MTGERNGTGLSCYHCITGGEQNPAGFTKVGNEAWQKHYLCDLTYAYNHRCNKKSPPTLMCDDN